MGMARAQSSQQDRSQFYEELDFEASGPRAAPGGLDGSDVRVLFKVRFYLSYCGTLLEIQI